MKKGKFLCLIALFGILSGNVFSQADSLAKINKELSKIFLGVGGGGSINGLGVSFSGTFILSDNWGGSIRFNGNFLKAKNLPDDYYDFVLFIPFVANGLPTDNIQILSVNIIKEFPTRLHWMKFGTEAGLSWVNSQVANFTPNSSTIPFLGSNYDLTRDIKNTVGFSIMGKAEFPVSRFVGAELDLYTNLNGSQSVFGINVCLNVGLVKDRQSFWGP